MSLSPGLVDVWPCYRCGYGLVEKPRSAMCSECGSDDHVLQRRQARALLRQPLRLAYRALMLWRPMPPALWANGANPRFVSGLRKGRFRRLILALLFAAILLVC